MNAKPGKAAVAEKSPTWVRVFTAALALALVALGVGSWRTLSNPRKEAAKIEAREARAIALLEAENDRLAPATTPAPVPPIPAPRPAESKPIPGRQRVDALNLLTDLAHRGYFATPSPGPLLRQLSSQMSPNIVKVPQPAYMIDANGNFGSGFAEFFGLAGSEAASLQAGLSNWQEEMAQAIQAKTAVRRQDDGSVVLEVSPVDGAPALRERFTTLLQEGLGPERFRLFKDLNSGSQSMEEGALPAVLTGNMNFFGEATATYTVTWTPTNTRVEYKIKLPNGGAGGSDGGGLAMSPAAMREQLIKAHGPVMKLLPTNF